MTEEQLDLLRHLIKQEIDAAQIDGMEHGAWGWADRQLEEGWKCFKNSFSKTRKLDDDFNSVEHRQRIKKQSKTVADYMNNELSHEDYCEASLDLSNQDAVGEAGAMAALDSLYANNDEGMKFLADS